MERPLTVSQLARATGVTAKTIRYYEQVGVLPAPRRSAAQYRQYSRRDVHRLLFVRRARALGLWLRLRGLPPLTTGATLAPSRVHGRGGAQILLSMWRIAEAFGWHDSAD